MNRGESGREREATSPVLQLGDLLFQKVAGRVAAARIIQRGMALTDSTAYVDEL